MEARDIDIVSYLRHKGIRYWERGKNVSQDWIGIKCLWCDDPTNHLGIHLGRGTINCFRCPTKGTFFRVVMKVERCNYETAIRILSKFNRFRSEHIYPLPEDRSLKFERLGESHYNKNVLSQFNFDDNMLPIHEQYLIGRNFDPEWLTKKYELKFCGPIGDYRLRVIIPVFDNGKCISFTARDATNKSPSPYLNCPNDKSIYDIRDTVYNLDNSTSPDTIIVEGTTDVWRIGDNCVATFGVKYTPMQVLTLSQYRRCFILYDAEPKAQEQADKLGKDLSTVVNEVIRLELAEGDPAEMSEDDVKSLRKQVFGRIY